MYMPVSITDFRRNLFQLAEKALHGEAVQFIHKGVVFKVVPEQAAFKLARLTRENVIAPGVSLDASDLFKEMEEEWQKDWSEI